MPPVSQYVRIFWGGLALSYGYVFAISGPPPYSFPGCDSLHDVVWGRTVLHIHGSHFRDNHPWDQLEMVRNWIVFFLEVNY